LQGLLIDERGHSRQRNGPAAAARAGTEISKQ
jgi:hypothetical protein